MIGDIINAGYTAYKDVVASSQRVQGLKLSQQVLLRSYYFEVCLNLDLLSVVEFDKLDSLKVYSPSVLVMLSSLETQVAAAIFLSDDETSVKLYEFLSLTGNVEETSEESEKTEQIDKSVLDAIRFTLQKITVLQKLSAIKSEPEADILKTMRLKVRMNNIKEHLLFIRKQIESRL